MPDAISAAPGRSNDEWVAALRAEGPSFDAAWQELRARLVTGLRKSVGARVGDDTCEDLAQEAVLRVVDRLGSFRGESRFTTWAMAIAVRMAFDELRHRRWKDVSFDVLTEEAVGPATFEGSPAGDQDRRLTREHVLQELKTVIDGKLTEKQRRVLAAELQGMPQSEIAAQLGMNRNALYKLSHDARRKVKAQLEAAGFAGPDVMWAFS